MTPRWVTERLYANGEGDYLQVVTVYAEGENKETVKRENRDWTYRRKLLLIENDESMAG